VFSQVDLSPAVLLTELSDSLADLDADVRGHSPSIDLVQALYLVDALFHLLCASGCAKSGRDRSKHLWKVIDGSDQDGLSRQLKSDESVCF
jgi:hypothetical protein